MSGKQAMQFQKQVHGTLGEEKVEAKHGVGHQLGRYCDEHVVDFDSALLLRYVIDHGQDESRQKIHEAEGGKVIDNQNRPTHE